VIGMAKGSQFTPCTGFIQCETPDTCTKESWCRAASTTGVPIDSTPTQFPVAIAGIGLIPLGIAEAKTALGRIAEALRFGNGDSTFSESYVNEQDWNPKAHIEITLTIADARAVYAALNVLNGGAK
jgi:hypothetical protein